MHACLDPACIASSNFFILKSSRRIMNRGHHLRLCTAAQLLAAGLLCCTSPVPSARVHTCTLPAAEETAAAGHGDWARWPTPAWKQQGAGTQPLPACRGRMQRPLRTSHHERHQLIKRHCSLLKRRMRQQLDGGFASSPVAWHSNSL